MVDKLKPPFFVEMHIGKIILRLVGIGLMICAGLFMFWRPEYDWETCENKIGTVNNVMVSQGRYDAGRTYAGVVLSNDRLVFIAIPYGANVRADDDVEMKCWFDRDKPQRQKYRYLSIVD